MATTSPAQWVDAEAMEAEGIYGRGYGADAVAGRGYGAKESRMSSQQASSHHAAGASGGGPGAVYSWSVYSTPPPPVGGPATLGASGGGLYWASMSGYAREERVSGGDRGDRGRAPGLPAWQQVRVACVERYRRFITSLSQDLVVPTQEFGRILSSPPATNSTTIIILREY
eukprot:857885-Prorocentrum_minimum.AAC.4